MTPAEWSTVKEILSGALECPPVERSAFLEKACGRDPALRRRVDALIEADERAWSMLEAPAAASSSLAALRLPVAGERVGAYELLSELGHGGMGVVFLARRADDQFEKKVAIKLARSGIAGDSLERRFRAERQIVAGLDHPNIARLLDGGSTPDGRLYFVMEYVEGQPLTRWCQAHPLGTRERLEIFLEVCAAVQYAHQHLVVHRDLKPANILVTEQGKVKLLDFGIAKLVDPDPSGEAAERTGTLFRLLTPDYASPEQVRGELISTSTDVYALGVVLYELLTGERPYRVEGCSPAEMQWIICEREPARPSSRVEARLGKELAGDLDTIVLTALRKEPGRRYRSVDAFSQDIRFHLSGQPIEARTDAFGYRAGKFVRRHRAAVAASALVGLALSGGLVMTLREARRARAAEARAEQRFNEVRKLANSYLFELHDAIRDLPGSTAARGLLVKRALEYLDSLSREKGSDPGLQRELAAAYQRVGDVLGRAGEANLGDVAGSQASYRKALEIRQRLATRRPNDRALLLELATSYDSNGEPRNALEIRERVAREKPGDIGAQKALEVSYHGLAVFHADRKEFDKSLVYRQKQTEMAEAVRKAAPGDPRASRDLALAYKYMGGAFENLKRPLEGLAFYRKAALLDEERAAASLPGSQARLDLSFDYGGVGNCLASSGDLNGGLENYGKALQLREEAAAADPRNSNARYSVARAHAKIGWILGQRGDYEGSLQAHRKALEMRRALVSSDPSNPGNAFDVSETLESIGAVHAAAAGAHGQSESSRRAHWAEARRSYVESREIALDLERRGQLKGIIDGRPEGLAAQIALCDEALKRPSI